jgi:predicted esterase
VLSALEEGVTVDELLAFLEARSGRPLPDPIALFLAELGERVSRLVAQGPGLLIEARDALLAQLIANDSRTRSLCMLAGQRHLVVPSHAENAFRRALHEMGYGVR